METEIVHKELSYKINGILFTVHNELGRYRNEKQYGDLIEWYLQNLQIPYKREFVLPVSFNQERGGRNKLDFIIDNTIILEIKAKTFLEKSDYYQTKRYLTSLNKRLAVLVNFRQKYLAPKRIVNGYV